MDTIKTVNIAILVFCVLMFNYPKFFNNSYYSFFEYLGLKRVDFTKKENKKKIDYLAFGLLIPVIILIYLVHQEKDWFKFIGTYDIIPEETFNFVVSFIGAFAFIYTFSSKVGMFPGINQSNLIQSNFFQFIMLFSISSAFTKDKNKGVMATLFYYIMRNNFSHGIEHKKN